MNKIAAAIIAGVLIIVAIIAFTFKPLLLGKYPQPDTSAYHILKSWEMPDALEEISGIAWLGGERMACIQDEEGIIFIYDLKTSKIEKKIKFGDSGDYEGIAVNGKDAYVIESDGKLFEIRDFESTSFEVKSFKTPLNSKNNVEGICMDANNEQLLLSVKEKEKAGEQYKGIYSFNLKSKKMKKKPIFKINLKDSIFSRIPFNRLDKVFRPSEINIHPKTGEIYILDGSKPKLLILTPNGKTKQLIFLSEDNFAQPEGLTFTPAGQLFISNEADHNRGNILKVKLSN